MQRFSYSGELGGSPVLKDNLGRLYQKVAFLQALLALMVIVSALVVDGRLAAMSALSGGASVLVGSMVYAAFAKESNVSASSAGRVFRRHLLAEVAKIVVILLLLFCALWSGWFAAGWLVAAMGMTLAGHWFAVFIIR